MQLFSYIYPHGKGSGSNEERYVGGTEQQEGHDISKEGKMQMRIYWRLVKGKTGLNRGGVYVSSRKSAVLLCSVLWHSFSINKELKRVYRFLFHIQLSNSLNHTIPFHLK